MKTVIVGGVAGGASAAARLRRLDEDAEIVMLERTGYVSYANCGLPYYVGGTITERDDLTLQTPESFRNRFNIDVRVKSEVVSVDRQAKSVHVKDLSTGKEYDESYDKLILSPGAKPLLPPFGPVDDPRVMTLRTVEDCLALYEMSRKPGVRTVAVAGGGYIGLETAENLVDLGLNVILLQRSNQVMPPVDYEIAAEIHDHIRAKGIDFRPGSAVAGIDTGEQLKVKIADGREIPADLVVIALGVTPESHLAKDAGLVLGVKGTIAVDDHMLTSDPDIYAVGDAVQVKNSVSGDPSFIALAGPANKQGRIAADNICGIPSTYKGTQGSSIIKIFDMTVGFTGLSEKAAKAAGIEADKVFTYSASHATYYPGHQSMSVKTVFDPKDGRILGAQIVGYEGVDKRVDVMAVAIRAGMNAQDLADLDLAYAPPYSSAKDPVNMAGFVITNILAGRVRQVHWTDIPAIKEAPEVVILDTRTDEEFEEAHFDDCVHIPVDELRVRLPELDKSKRYCVVCHTGLRSYVACRMMTQHGFDCFNLSGGMRLYRAVVCGCESDPCTLACGLSKGLMKH